MANRLILRDRRKDPWRKVNVRLFWDGGGQDGVWVDESGIGEFGGSGIVSHIVAGGETIKVYERVNGNDSIVVISRDSH